MCGRKTLTKGKIEIMEELFVDEWEDDFDWEPSYNIAPTQISPVLLNHGKRKVKPMYWGLVPSWAKDKTIGAKMINARSETLGEKPSFQSLIYQKRCIVISDGYFEWKREGKKKKPYYIRDPDGKLLPMAGLWDEWVDKQGKKWLTYTVITTDPSNQINHIHNRMPVILDKPEMDLWINFDCPPNEALTCLKPYEKLLELYPVSTFVNSPANNSNQCILPTENLNTLTMF